SLQELPGLLDTLVHFSNGLGEATNQLAPAVTPQYGQADSDIGLAIKRTRDSFGECDVTTSTSGPAAANTEHSNQVRIVPCFDQNGNPYVDPVAGRARHHIKVLFGLHTNGTPPPASGGPTPEDEGDVLCGPDSGNSTRGSNPAFTCITNIQ